MKTAILITVFCISNFLKATHKKMELQKALDEHLVEARALSLGSYQNRCMDLFLKNISTDSLIVIVEAGRRLKSVIEYEQDILVTKEEMIVLAKKQAKWIPVTGFCCEASNHCPRKNSKYELNKLADPDLVRVAKYINAGNFDTETIQNAVWAVSDRKPTAQITARNDSLAMPLRRQVSIIKGETLPWYTVITKTMIYSSGRMEVFPIELRGKMNYSNDTECYTTLHVLDKNGMEVCQIVRQWTLAGNGDYEVYLPIKGLARGKYTVELNSSNKNLAKKEFQI